MRGSTPGADLPAMPDLRAPRSPFLGRGAPCPALPCPALPCVLHLVVGSLPMPLSPCPLPCGSVRGMKAHVPAAAGVTHFPAFCLLLMEVAQGVSGLVLAPSSPLLLSLRRPPFLLALCVLPCFVVPTCVNAARACCFLCCAFRVCVHLSCVCVPPLWVC